MEWQPIETAPKGYAVAMGDATRGFKVRAKYLLGFVPSDAPAHNPALGITVIWWEPLSGPNGKGAWHSDIDEGISPSHWMPLPEPPK